MAYIDLEKIQSCIALDFFAENQIKMFTNAKNIVNIYNCDSVVLPHLFAMQ